MLDSAPRLLPPRDSPKPSTRLPGGGSCGPAGSRHQADAKDRWAALGLGPPPGSSSGASPQPSGLSHEDPKLSLLPVTHGPRAQLQYVLPWKLETDPLFAGKLHCTMGTRAPQTHVPPSLLFLLPYTDSSSYVPNRSHGHPPPPSWQSQKTRSHPKPPPNLPPSLPI